MTHQGVGDPRIQEIAPGVFIITKLVHFFAKIGVNAGIIHTPDSIVFIDSGMWIYSGALRAREEALLFAKYLRHERQQWKPRIVAC